MHLEPLFVFPLFCEVSLEGFGELFYSALTDAIGDFFEPLLFRVGDVLGGREFVPQIVEADLPVGIFSDQLEALVVQIPGRTDPLSEYHSLFHGRSNSDLETSHIAAVLGFDRRRQ